jgi:hypothetical protein
MSKEYALLELFVQDSFPNIKGLELNGIMLVMLICISTYGLVGEYSLRLLMH